MLPATSGALRLLIARPVECVAGDHARELNLPRFFLYADVTQERFRAFANHASIHSAGA